MHSYLASSHLKRLGYLHTVPNLHKAERTFLKFCQFAQNFVVKVPKQESTRSTVLPGLLPVLKRMNQDKKCENEETS